MYYSFDFFYHEEAIKDGDRDEFNNDVDYFKI